MRETCWFIEKISETLREKNGLAEIYFLRDDYLDLSF